MKTLTTSFLFFCSSLLSNAQNGEHPNFFLSHYFITQNNFGNNYITNEDSIQITRIEVWVSDTVHSDTLISGIAFTDLGEPKPNRAILADKQNCKVPSNYSNKLYKQLTDNPSFRLNDNAVSTITSAPLFLQKESDFKRGYFRKLPPNEFVLNSNSGYISLNTPITPKTVLAVAYQYTYMGHVYQVGEFENQLPKYKSVEKLIFLKLVK